MGSQDCPEYIASNSAQQL